MNITKRKVLSITTPIIILAICFVVLFFYCVPNGDAVKNTMENDDFIALTDVTDSTPILGLLLPDGANRSLTFTKNVNLNFDTVIVIYFDDYKSLKSYKDNLEPSDGDIALSRGKALFMGSEDATKSIRWKVWAF